MIEANPQGLIQWSRGSRGDIFKSGCIEYGSADFFALFGMQLSDYFRKPKSRPTFRAPLRGDRGMVRK